MGRILIILTLAGFAAALAAGTETQPASQPASSLDYWLQRAETANASQPATGVIEAGRRKTGPDGFSRDDAIPGVVLLSDGRLLPGGVYTTRDKPFLVWVESEKRWRRIPPAACLSISAKVVEERMELVWRWKAMGEPERVYTGEKYPFRRFLWTFRLADGSTITGAVKGQPVWVELPETAAGPFLLPERSKGEKGQSLKELVYVKKIIFSRAAMKAARRHIAETPASKPAK